MVISLDIPAPILGACPLCACWKDAGLLPLVFVLVASCGLDSSRGSLWDGERGLLELWVLVLLRESGCREDEGRCVTK